MLYSVLADLAEQRRERDFLVDSRTHIAVSYDEALGLLHRVSALFNQAGLKPKDSIVSILPNSIENLILFFGCGAFGINFVPLSEVIGRSELETVIRTVRPRAVVVPPFLPRSLMEVLSAESIRVIHARLDLRFTWLPEARPLGLPNAEDAHLLIATSGTTGGLRLINHSIAQLWAQARTFVGCHDPLLREARFLNNLSMSYLGGLLNLALVPLACGGSIVVDEPFRGKASFTLWHDIRRFDVSVVWCPPSLLWQLVRDAKLLGRHIFEDIDRQLRVVLTGMAPSTLAEKTLFEETFSVPVLENYGLSETGFISTETVENRRYRTENSVGSLLPGVDLRFGKTALADGYREILARTPYMFEGYLFEEESGSAGLQDGYLTTGDVGRLDDNGMLVLGGRLREIVKRGDLLIHLQEIEGTARQHEAVQDASARKISHRTLGESYELYLVLRPEKADYPVEQFRAWLHQMVSRERWPEDVIIVDELPWTASRKVRKHMLAKPAR